MRRYNGIFFLLIWFFLPPVAGVAGREGAADRTAPEKQYSLHYRVKKGETLMSIARRKEIFNDPFLWPLIYKANRDQIRDPHIIFPGQVLSIPRNVTTEEMAEARRQASAPITPYAPIKSVAPGMYPKSSPTHTGYSKGGEDNQTGRDR